MLGSIYGREQLCIFTLGEQISLPHPHSPCGFTSHTAQTYSAQKKPKLHKTKPGSSKGEAQEDCLLVTAVNPPSSSLPPSFPPSLTLPHYGLISLFILNFQIKSGGRDMV